jgi:hypothetical protein
MNQTQRGFGAILKTMAMGISLTTIGSIVLAVVFAAGLDGCARVAEKIKPESAPVAINSSR